MAEATEPNQTGRPPDRRKLVAVMYADMIGYSRLIGLDDAGTLQRLRALRQNLIDPAIEQHGGRIVQTGGDSLLIVFDSIDGAVRCAVEVQQHLPAHDGQQLADRAIRFRIGINIGDAIADGTDLHGDAVNVAVRLQAECPPGGICVSRAVRDHVHGRLDLAFEELGALSLKNIARPVVAFVVSPPSPGSAAASAVVAADNFPALPDKPSIVVLAFANMSGDRDQEYFSDGITEDIITELSRTRWLFVIARNTSFVYKGRAIDTKQVGRELGVRYLLEGSVRRSGSRVRVTAQLIDARSGSHIWAERYDRDVTDVFAVQDEITLSVAQAIGPAVVEAEQSRALRKAPESLGAWEAYQRGLWHLSRKSPEDAPLARSYFNRALGIDPTLAAAHTGLAALYHIESGIFAQRPLTEGLRLGAEEAGKAVDIDPTDAEALAYQAFAVGIAGDLVRGLEQVERALSINPNCAQAYRAKGWLLMNTGKPREGRESFQFAMRIDPRSALDVVPRSHIVETYYLERDYASAVAAAKRLIADRPDHPWPYRWLAAALGQLGQTKEAHEALNQAIAAAPDTFYRFVRQRMPWVGVAEYEHMLEGLRKAGWEG